ncbi:hypothetical protein ESA94_20445 [Lacibacter luteus]|uniref:DUF6046 domain-containing protein n=1 Tax=Lacibacter luteus TaxID=2508719 RepID=A0A4Q1CDH1_9BACT|nr:DUF6046 domain-containing protein [Lacibacter luteus]RXK57571.1 hypothetical protein ESA94_20445 [Lacibacter luteus]
MNYLVVDIAELYKQRFGKKPVVPEVVYGAETNAYQVTPQLIQAEQEFTQRGSLVKERYRGVEIMLPLRFYDGSELLMYMPYAVISMNNSKTIVETSLPERVGTVKEQWSIGDYEINIKGFLISENRLFPEEEISQLRELYEAQKAVTLDNALSNIFLSNKNLEPSEQRRVVIYRLNIDEVQGGREHVRPFTMQLKSDTVFTLELK